MDRYWERDTDKNINMIKKYDVIKKNKNKNVMATLSI